MRCPMALAGAFAAATLAGCDLQEVTVVDVEEVLIAEVYVNLAANPRDNEVFAFVHGTLGAEAPTLPPNLVDATARVTRDDGLVLPLTSSPESACLEGSTTGPGVCLVADSTQARLLAPGDRLELRVELPDGRELFGATTVPGDFQLDGDIRNTCRLEPETLLPLSWTRSDGAWAYINETIIVGLRDLLAPEGIDASNRLYLLGLSVSSADTTIVFPSEFGLFERFDLDQDLAVRLQSGLPEGTHAEIAITAVDRNYVNWVRGGSFNPSGQVRVPSLRGDGTGVFASTVSRGFTLLVTTPTEEVNDCPTD
jgi:hypothetical protein